MSTHNYVHEYKRVSKKVPGTSPVEYDHQTVYLGSRCTHDGKRSPLYCQDSRNRVTLPVVKEHNDSTGTMFGNGRLVQK